MNAVDRLGRVQAEIAALREEEAALKGEVFNMVQAAGGVAEAPHSTIVEGVLFKAVLIEAERTTTNWKKIATDLGASLQKIRANSKTALVTTIKVTARSTAARRAA